MSTTRKLIAAFVLFSLFSIAVATPAYAFDGRGGDKVVIQADQVINDDLYVGANEFVLDGTVNGDTVAFAQMVTINGTVNGDLISAAQTVVVNGTVTGGIRMAAGVLFMGEKAKISGDVVGAGYSLELRKGSTVGRDLVFATGQTLLAGNVDRNVLAATSALEIDGTVGGNVKAQIAEATQRQAGPPPTMFMRPSTVPVPIVTQGLSIDPSAKIKGDLEYTQNVNLPMPAGVVAGKVTRLTQPIQENRPAPEKTAEQKAAEWVLQSARSLITLLLVGLLLLWLFPLFMTTASAQLGSKPLPSLGWGVVAWAGFVFLILLIVFVTILGAIAFGLLTLGGLSGTIVGLGLLALFVLITGFSLATAFVAKILFGISLGKWLLAQMKTPLATHRYWPMVIGVSITVAVIALLTFPLIPGFLGWLLDLIIVLLGLGALWLWARDKFARKPAVQTS
jgi:cytoskeletal protein CcmA (bactofilin family)